MRVQDVMRTPVETIAGHELTPAAARAMCEHDLRLLVVISDEGHVIGTITDRDIVRVVAAGQDPTRHRVAELCADIVYSVTPDDDLATVARVMGEHGVRRLPVCRDRELVGIVALDDLAPGHLTEEGILRAMSWRGERGSSRRSDGSRRSHVRRYLQRHAG